MISLTSKEREALLILFKEFTSFYNANSISKILGISHAGAQKLFKRLLKGNLVVSRTIGKSIIYKMNLADEYVNQLIVFLLADEANNFKRWKEEFKELFKKDMVVLIYGSAIKNYTQAEDIDILLVIEKKEFKEVNKILKEKKQVLPKRLHALKLTSDDLSENLKKKNKAMIDIVKTAIVLHGQDEYAEMIKNVAGF